MWYVYIQFTNKFITYKFISKLIINRNDLERMCY